MKSDSPCSSVFFSVRWWCLDFMQFCMSLMLLASDYTKIIAAGETELCSSGLLQKGWIALFEPAHGWKSAIKASFSKEVDSNFMYWGNRKKQPVGHLPFRYTFVSQRTENWVLQMQSKHFHVFSEYIFKASFPAWVSIMVIVYNFVASASCNLVQAL